MIHASAPIVERHPHVRVVDRRGEREEVHERAAEGGERGVLHTVVENHAHTSVGQGDQQLQHEDGQQRAHRVEGGEGVVPDLKIGGGTVGV